MYSQSNSFMGGANSARPGAGGFGQNPSFNNQFQPGSGQSPFAPQPTGFGGQGMQPQQTGMPGYGQQQSFQNPQMQPQPTGYSLQNQAQQFQQPQQTGFQQPQQTGFGQFQSQQPQQQPPPQPMRPQQTSAPTAQSFSAPSAPAQPSNDAKNAARIPTIRLSFITATDQAKFEQLFKSAAGDEQALSGDKARDLLMRSKLPGNALSQIWVLSDTTKSGQLLFPEFALAMYLCNLRLTGKEMPAVLPDKVKNEVSSMVDIISFGIPDDRPAPPSRSNAPNFDAPLRQNAVSPPVPQQPTPQQPSNTQLLNQLTSQPTGFYNQATGFQPGMQPQMTGFPGQQPGFQAQQSMQPQQTGFGAAPQATGYNGPRPPMPPMPTGFQSSPQPTGPLQAQPTGIPGQWGFVNAPAGGLPNIDALKQRLMPQAGREGGFTTQGLAGSAKVPWAITKDEKRIYDDLFRAWDGFNKGHITGDVATELMGQSGLEQRDLEAIWNLADPNNKGRLDMDEFAVAMHLMYRKLNGYPVPARLPPELVPPSTRNFNSSIDKVKGLLSQDANARKSSGAFLQPQRTGVSYLKEHTFRGGASSPSFGRKDATVFRNNDEAIGYRSSARRRLGGTGGDRTPSPASSTAESAYDDMTPDQIRKKIREAKVLLDATDFRDQNADDDDDAMDRRDRREAEDLFRQIRRLQDDIDTHPNAAFGGAESGAERRSMRRELQRHQDRVPALASQVRAIEKSISDAKLQLFRLKDAKAFPNSASTIVGTGPGGQVTEADRIKARARARMQARAAELAGRPAPAADDEGATQRRLEEEQSKVRADQQRNETMTRDVEESVKDFATGLEEGLKVEGQTASSEHEKRRWDEGLGVEDEVKELIFELQRNSRTAKVRKEERNRPTQSSPAPTTAVEEPRSTNGDVAIRPAPPSQTASTSSFSAQDRVAAAKEKALKRIQDRMAAAGLKPASDAGESASARADREKREREDRIKQAEAEDAKREQERQARLANEGVAPAPGPASPKASKKPPPPPVRKSRQESNDFGDRRASEASAKAKAEEDAAQELRAEQQASEAERKRLEYVPSYIHLRLDANKITEVKLKPLKTTLTRSAELPKIV